MMQGQSSRARKGPIPDNSPPVVSKPKDGKDANSPKMAKFSTVDPPVTDFPTSPPPSCDFNQDEDIVPWLNYTVAEPLSNECRTDLLPGLSGGTVNGHSTADNLTLTEKKNNYSRMMTDDHLKSATNAFSSRQGSVSKATLTAGDTSRSRNGDRPHLMQNKHHASGSGMCDSTRTNVGNTSQLNARDSVQCQSQMDGSTSLYLHNKQEGQPRNDSNFMNFSYFSRLASSPGVNNRNSVSSTPGALSCSTHILGNDDKGAPIIGGHPLESIRFDPNIGCSRQESNSHAHATLPQLNMGVESRASDRYRDSFPPRQSGATCSEDHLKNDKSPNQASCPATAGAVIGGEKNIEPVVAASSLGSCNSLERGSNNPNSYLKRKASETVESESPTEEVEEGSVGVRQTSVPRTRTKRSRAAEVHNLSERRRRDRINEKMRSLQELIPNCNKADKASMLDEAIEYLKTLQLQVQMLSMGAGMYMPPMMVPPAMQHIHRSQMPHFTPMAMNGMGMGLAFGMGMHELNNSMMQMPPMSGPCYPLPGFPQISSSSAFPGLAGSCNQGFGYPTPGQIPMPHLPLPLGDTAALKLPTGNVPTMHGGADDPLIAPSTISTDMVQNIGAEVIRNANNANGPTKQDSAQVTALLNHPPQAVNTDNAQNLAGDSNTKTN